MTLHQRTRPKKKVKLPVPGLIFARFLVKTEIGPKSNVFSRWAVSPGSDPAAGKSRRKAEDENAPKWRRGVAPRWLAIGKEGIAMKLDVVIGDVPTAFLHATLTGKVFVTPPAEYYPQGGVLWRLKRALYGLKDSPKAWQQHLAHVMAEAGFERLKSDPNLYRQRTKALFALVYVDDLMFVGDKRNIHEATGHLKQSVLIRQTGDLTEGQVVSFLGRKIR